MGCSIPRAVTANQNGHSVIKFDECMEGGHKMLQAMNADLFAINISDVSFIDG